MNIILTPNTFCLFWFTSSDAQGLLLAQTQELQLKGIWLNLSQVHAKQELYLLYCFSASSNYFIQFSILPTYYFGINLFLEWSHYLWEIFASVRGLWLSVLRQNSIIYQYKVVIAVNFMSPFLTTSQCWNGYLYQPLSILRSVKHTLS